MQNDITTAIGINIHKGIYGLKMNTIGSVIILKVLFRDSLRIPG